MIKYLKRARSGLVNPIRSLSGLIPFLLLAVGGFIMLKAYNLFIKDSPSEKAQEKDEKIAVKNYLSKEASESTGIDLIVKNLSKQGYNVNAQHISIANLLHSLLDSAVVDYDKIVRTIRGTHTVTYKLIFAAYKLRELANYRNAHYLDGDVWKDLFADKKLYGSLKYHLEVVLPPDQLKKINSWLILT